MKNRWSDAARAAALAVRKARAFAANPQDKGKTDPKRGGLARKAYPMAYAGGSETFDESTGTRNNPGKNVWIPPDGGAGTQYEEGMKDLVAKKKLLAANALLKSMPPKRPPGGGGKNIPRVEVGRVIIGGKRYTRVGNKLTPDEK